MKDMLDVLRGYPVGELIADLLTLIAICATLYVLTIVGGGMVPQ